VRRSLGAPSALQVLLPSLLELGRAIQQSQTASIEAISYRAGVIDVRLTAPDVATLDKIQKAVSSSGRFSAAIQSTDQVGDKINSRIQIRETGA
jgi:type II secretory pathway component PulL